MLDLMLNPVGNQKLHPRLVKKLSACFLSSSPKHLARKVQLERDRAVFSRPSGPTTEPARGSQWRDEEL